MEPILPQIQSNLLLYISTIFCFISVITILAFVVPLQIKQAGVRNGLAKLRIQLVGMGITILTTTLIASFFLSIVSYKALITPNYYVSTLSQLLLFIFSSGKVLIAFFGYKIYHQQYTIEHIEASNRIDAYMKAKEKNNK
jgi:hypothetical protein